VSMQAVSGHSSSWIVDTPMMKFQISKQIIVTGAQVITACRAVLVFEVRVTNSRLGNSRLLDWTAIWNGIKEKASGAYLNLKPSCTSGPPCNKLNLGQCFVNTSDIITSLPGNGSFGSGPRFYCRCSFVHLFISPRYLQTLNLIMCLPDLPLAIFQC